MAKLQASEIRRLIDLHCDEFESSWRSGAQRTIRELLTEVPDEVRQHLFGELLAMELELRARAGERLDVDVYHEAFPNHGPQIEQAFDEFRSWLQATKAVDESSKPRIIAVPHDTDRHALPTANWSDPKQAPATGFLARKADIPTRVGRYEVAGKLGSGGMGTVLLAWDPVLERQVALKLPHFDARDGQEAINRFYREARAMAKVHHPNLCPIHDVGGFEGLPYLSMAYIEGRSLAEEIDNSAPMPPEQSAELVRTLALALQAVHDAGIQHRDLKPSNVMIDKNDVPFITDFGLASRDQQDDSEITNSGAIIGTPTYMAPEQVRAEPDRIGPRTDVYALGGILYELLSGRRPYEGAAVVVLGQITAGIPPTPLEELIDVDPSLRSVCKRAMAPDPEDRIASAAELAAFLEPFTEAVPTGALPKSLPSKVAVKTPRANGADPRTSKRADRALWITGSILLLAFAVILSVLAFNGPEPPDSDSDQQTVTGLSTDAPPEYELAVRLLHQGLPSNRGRFGGSVAMDGKYAIIGAHSTQSSANTVGVAYILAETEKDSPDGPGWRIHATLKPNANAAGHHPQFGREVGIWGDRVVVGARADREAGKNAGAAYVFVREKKTWRLEQKLLPADSENYAQFGRLVSIGPRHLAIGSTGTKGGRHVHIYSRDKDNSWQAQPGFSGPMKSQVLAIGCTEDAIVVALAVPSAGRGTDLVLTVLQQHEGVFREKQSLTVVREVELGGTQVDLAVADDRLVVGVPKDLSDQGDGCGAAHVFRRDGQNWQFEQKLLPENPVDKQRFGAVVALDGNRLFVSAIKGKNGGTDSHTVYAFERNETAWVQRQQIQSLQASATDQFGHAVAVAGNRAIIGAPEYSARTHKDGQLTMLTYESGLWRPTKGWRPSVRKQPSEVRPVLLGAGLAMGNGFVAVSAPHADGTQCRNAGVVHIYAQDKKPTTHASTNANRSTAEPVSSLEYQTTLRARVEVNHASFGLWLSSFGKRLAVNAPGTGLVHIFEREDERWSQVELEPPDNVSYVFDGAVALGKDWLAVRTRAADPKKSDDVPGSVCLFLYQDGHWQLLQRLQAKDSAPGDNFGQTLSMRGDLLLIGAPTANPSGKGSGAAYLFKRQGKQWRQVQKLTAQDGSATAWFGTSVAIGQEHLIVGASGHRSFGNRSGSVYVFRREGSQWQSCQQLFASDASHDSYFGSSVAVDGNRLLIGAEDESSRAPEAGAAYLFYFDGHDWQEHRKLAPDRSGYKQHFGRALTLSDDGLLIGACREANGAGAVYWFQPVADSDP